MRTFWLVGVIAAGLSGMAYGGDDRIDRPELFGTPPAQWKYTHLTSSAVIKASSGVLGCVTINRAAPMVPDVPFSVYDSSDVNTVPNIIATFDITASSRTQTGSYCFHATTNEGITVLVPSGPSITVTYR